MSHGHLPTEIFITWSLVPHTSIIVMILWLFEGCIVTGYKRHQQNKKISCEISLYMTHFISTKRRLKKSFCLHTSLWPILILLSMFSTLGQNFILDLPLYKFGILLLYIIIITMITAAKSEALVHPLSFFQSININAVRVCSDFLCVHSFASHTFYSSPSWNIHWILQSFARLQYIFPDIYMDVSKQNHTPESMT